MRASVSASSRTRKNWETVPEAATEGGCGAVVRWLLDEERRLPMLPETLAPPAEAEPPAVPEPESESLELLPPEPEEAELASCPETSRVALTPSETSRSPA